MLQVKDPLIFIRQIAPIPGILKNTAALASYPEFIRPPMTQNCGRFLHYIAVNQVNQTTCELPSYDKSLIIANVGEI